MSTKICNGFKVGTVFSRTLGDSPLYYGLWIVRSMETDEELAFGSTEAGYRTTEEATEAALAEGCAKAESMERPMGQFGWGPK